MKNIKFVFGVVFTIFTLSVPLDLFSQTWLCGSPIRDTRDNTVYNTVLIGNQCWFQTNLNYGTRINGTTQQSNNGLPEKYCYNNLDANCNIYGGLYQWGEVVQYLNGSSNTTSMNPPILDNVQGLCPDGWKIPSDQAWCALTTFLDNTVNCGTIGLTGTIAGGELKEKGTSHWFPYNTGATNVSLFTGLPGGGRLNNGTFSGLSTQTGFWTFSEYSQASGYVWGLSYTTSRISHSNNDKTLGFSVRCYKDCQKPDAPSQGTNMKGSNQINWFWRSSQGATGYKFNTTNDFASADDIGLKNSYMENGLACNTSYTRYIWAYNACNHSDVTILSETTVGSYQSAPTEGHHLASETEITWKWNAAPLANGYKWNTLNDFSSAVDVGLNFFKVETSLTPNTVYTRYIWATNGDCGVSSPTTLTQNTKTNTFLCGQTIYDPRDGGSGQNYNTILIGNQCWIQQNMNVGTIADESGQTNDGIIQKFCYNNLSSNCAIYGGLYQWNEMMQYSTTPGAQGICPAGWYLPTDNDWCTLTTFLDNTVNCGDVNSKAGGQMKEVGITHWLSPNRNADNHSKFTALPGGGLIYPSVTYDNTGELADFWSSTQGNGNNASCRQLFYDQSYVGNSTIDKSSFQSVRCMKDCTPPSAPVQGTHVPSTKQIIWNWSTVPDALGYRWNYTNDYNSASELGTNSYTETGLSGNTTYTRYVWAYKDGSYSTATMLTETTTPGVVCPDHVIDNRPLGGNITYDVIQICSQCWMKQNLNYGQFQPDSSQPSYNDQLPEKYCYGGYLYNCTTYGGLYEWAEALNYGHGASNNSSYNYNDTVRGLCPPGWRIPTMDDFSTLLTFFPPPNPSPYSNEAGIYLKESGNQHWFYSPLSTGNNGSNFTALPSGFITPYQGYYGEHPLSTEQGSDGYFWTSTETYFNPAVSAVAPYAFYDWDTFMLNCFRDKYDRMPIRCIMDEAPDCSPIAANAGNDASICSGQSFTLGGSPSGTGGTGQYTYCWSTSPSFPPCFSTIANPVVSPTQTTTYYLTVTDLGGFGNSSTSQITITVLQGGDCPCQYPITFDNNLDEPIVSTNQSGDVVLYGESSWNTISFVSPNFGFYSITDNNSPYYKIFIGKFNQKGQKIWAHVISLPGPGCDTYYEKMVLDDSGDTYLVINTNDQYRFEDGAPCGLPPGALQGENYYSVIKINSTGVVDWTDNFTLGNAGGDVPSIISVDNNNLNIHEIYLSGISGSGLNNYGYTMVDGPYIAKIHKDGGAVVWINQNSSWSIPFHYVSLAYNYDDNYIYMYHGNQSSIAEVVKLTTDGTEVGTYNITPTRPWSCQYYFKYAGSNMFYLFSYQPDLCGNYSGNAVSAIQLTNSATLTAINCDRGYFPLFGGTNDYAYLCTGYPGYNSYDAIQKYDMLNNLLVSSSNDFTMNDYFTMGVNNANLAYGYYFHYYNYWSGPNTSELGQFDQTSLTLSFGCFGAKKDAEGIPDISKRSSNWNIYPNPAGDYLKISYLGNSPYKNVQFEVYNSMGVKMLLMNNNFNKSETTLNISNLPSGLYVIRIVSNGNQLESDKFIKQ
jgi:uncharacterized protein (TIGR02145 family)